MARARKNGLLDFFTKKKVTYRRDVKSERAQLVREQREQKTAEAKEKREREARLRARKREEESDRKATIKKHNDREKREDAYHRREAAKEKKELAALELAERRRKAEKKRADDVDRKIEREMREKGYRNPSKRNPELAAADLAEAWHGKPARNATEFIEQIHVHEFLTDLGRLMELEVSADGRYAKTVKFDKDTRLASSENGKQLYVVGGDQTLDLGAFGIKGDEAEKDLVVVGDVLAVTYVTAKHHLGKADKTPGPYRHALGEDGGECPTLLYDTMNGTIGFAGGSYKIVPNDYDGRHSAGLRN